MKNRIVTGMREYVRRYLNRPMVRPWALSVPLLVLVICLPLLRPLRHPGEISEDEFLRLATVRALVEHHTLSLNGIVSPDHESVVRIDGKIYAEQAPMLAVMLSVPAWTMYKFGLSFDDNNLLIAYLLTLMGVTLPVSAAGGLVYRMGRLFEFPRPWRAGLSGTCVLGSGLLSYAVVLNPHAPAAVLVLCCAACLIHVASLKLARGALQWLLVAGLCAGLAASLDAGAAMLGLLFMFVIAAMRFTLSTRVLGITLYLAGAAAPILVHDLLNRQITGDILPASLHEELARGVSVSSAAPEEDDFAGHSLWSAARGYVQWIFTALFGSHGLFSHFPILIFGIGGVGAVMHRHWPTTTKTLAAGTLVGASTIVTMYCMWRTDWQKAMFASRWFIVFTPMLVFWCGAWARRKREPTTWALAGFFLAFSMIVTLLGATNPSPPGGFDQYTPAEIVRRMFESKAPTPGNLGKL